MAILEKIKSYEDFKKIRKNELSILASELRQALINLSLSNEIHLSSNLGIVELTLALSYYFDLDKTKIIYDTGHQGYIHKMITGRYDKINQIRKDNGLAGLLEMQESKYDYYSPGHSGNTLSIGAGYNIASNQKIINVIGDSSFATGIALEAINFISYKNIKNIIVINDNNMSISPATGALSKLFSNKKKTKQVFENLGYKYIGFVDGHNFNKLFKAIRLADKVSEHKAVILHVKTIKGYGYEKTQNDKIGIYHSNSLKHSESFGSIAFNFLNNKLKNNSDLYILNPAMAIGTGFNELLVNKNKYYIDTGICEQHTLSLASGIAIQKKKVYCIYYSSFLQRAYDQLLHDVSRLNLNLTILLDRSDLSGGDGSSHHGIFDVPYLKTFPNTTITSFRNQKQFELLLDYSYHYNNGLFVIRYPKSEFASSIPCVNFDINQHEWEFIKLGNKTNIAIITYGPYVNKILNFIIENNLNIDVINAIFITNYSLDSMKKLLQYDYIICYERIFSKLGLYSDVLNFNNKWNLNKKIYSMCYKDIPKNGSTNNLDKQYNMDLDSIYKLILSIKN